VATMLTNVSGRGYRTMCPRTDGDRDVGAARCGGIQVAF
jgi:hypothetical protein